MRQHASRRTGWTTAAAACVCALAGCLDQSPSGGVIRAVSEYGEGGTLPGQLAYPRAIEAHADALYIIDKSARIQRFDLETGLVTARWRMPDWELGKPTGLTVAPGPDGRDAVYIADTHYHRVLIFDPEGPNEESDLPGGADAAFGGLGDEGGRFRYLTDVAVLVGDDGKPERIYVSEYGGNDRVSVFDADHAFLFSFGSFGSDDDRFDRPQSIEIVGDELVITDACNHRVGRFTLDGELIAWIKADESGAAMFRYPYGLEVLSDDTVLVSEFGASRVQRIDPKTGATLGVWGEPGHEEGQLAHPWAVAAVGDTAYVLDSGHNRVLGFRIGGYTAGSDR